MKTVRIPRDVISSTRASLRGGLDAGLLELLPGLGQFRDTGCVLGLGLVELLATARIERDYAALDEDTKRALLLRLLNDILDTAKLDKGAVALEVQDFSLRALCGQYGKRVYTLRNDFSLNFLSHIGNGRSQ